jgi:hypothetical protein
MAGCTGAGATQIWTCDQPVNGPIPPVPTRLRGAGPVTFAVVCELARVFPGVEETTAYRTPALKVKGKFLARLKEDGETLVLRMDFLDRDFHMRATPETFYITDHYRGYPAVLVRLATVDRAQLAQVIEDGWRLVAPKRLVHAFDGAPPSKKPGVDGGGAPNRRPRKPKKR